MPRVNTCTLCGSIDAFRYDEAAEGRKTVWLLEGWDYSHIDPQHVGKLLFCGGCGQAIGVAEDVLGIVEDVT